MSTTLHPFVDNGVTKGDPNFPGGKLSCYCKTDPVEVTLDSNVAFNHACGCSQCWKPPGALFSIVAVIPKDKIRVTANGDKLHVLDPNATILRTACKECGVHMLGPVEKEHPFQGLVFVHTELSKEKGWQEPQFAAFVSSIIEQGYHPKGMDSVRGKFKSLGLETYDCLSPTLMDIMATWKGKKNGLLPADA